MKKCGGGLRKAYAAGGMVLSDNQTKMLDSLDNRMGWGKYAGLPQPGDPAAIQRQNDAIDQQALDQEQGARAISLANDLSGSLGSGLSARQKAGALSTLGGMAAANGVDSGNLAAGVKGLSARQGLGMAMAEVGRQNTLGDVGLNLRRHGLTPAFANGGTVKVDKKGFIKGPKGDDKVPARVNETGEELRVADGERIVNKDQNEALEALAAEKGLDLDDYLAQATGQPVGPTLKGGLRAAAGGMEVGDRTAPWYSPSYARYANASQKTGLELEQERRAGVVSTPDDPARQLVASGTVGQPSLRQPTMPAPAAPAAKPAAPAAAGQPHEVSPEASRQATLADIASRNGLDQDIISSAKPGEPVRFMGEKDATQYDMPAGGSGGFVTMAPGKGGLRRTVFLDGNPTAADAARDADFKAKGYGKDAYGNWITPQRQGEAAALDKVKRERAEFDAYDPSITDPDARASGLRRMAAYQQADALSAAKQIEGMKMAFEQQKVKNLQANSDRDFRAKQIEARDKILNDWLDKHSTQVVDAKEGKSAMNPELRAQLGDSLTKLVGANGLPEDPDEVKKVLGQYGDEARLTVALNKAQANNHGWTDWRNWFARPAYTTSPVGLRSAGKGMFGGDLVDVGNGFVVPARDIVGDDADLAAALKNRLNSKK